ncbi:hypothetical protein GHT06_019494 [Daphnia sinensis]|uniref:BZIP domain-containing protein n=1 Tax=Daphnia sinensis TaxID=1820382 RepID=A0AAD5PPC1_9CRUS|nr:hypothetical protein GHT06_019494 [Daphnia sinensis]
MEFHHPHIKMELGEMDSNLGAFWSPAFEDDVFNSTFVWRDQGEGSLVTAENGSENRRKLATELLEVLESSKIQHDNSCSGWLEEPMDLEIFGQSLVESPSISLDESEAFSLSPCPSSPLTSEAPTPIQPGSPQELYPSQDDLFSIKHDVPVITIPEDNEKLIESLESLLHEITEEDLASTLLQPEISQEHEDITSLLLDSLIKGDVSNQVHDELAEFITLINENGIEVNDVSAIPIVPAPSVPSVRVEKLESSDPEWIPATPRSSGRKTNPNHTTAATLRKPRKKTLKADDRRLRKKEQNKTAATRYRIKKKAELDILLEEEAALEQRHRQLQLKHDDLANEVRYLKKLMREVFDNRKRR